MGGLLALSVVKIVKYVLAPTYDVMVPERWMTNGITFAHLFARSANKLH